jgi:hypothetical protein
LWWFTKYIAYREKLHVNELRERIVSAAEYITNEILVSTWRETEYLLDVCSATNGAHIELY